MYPTLSQQPSEATITFPSDNLRSIYELCGRHPSFTELLGMRQQIRLVIDTNIVLAELLFVTTKRRKDSARTALREVLDSGVVVTIAPTKMHEEVHRHIPRLARERVVPEEKLQQAWVELQTRIEFRDVGESVFLGKNVRDPDDVPFVVLYISSGADAVLTRDNDIAAMGAKSLGPDVLFPIRDYARAKSPEVTLRVGGVIVCGVAVGSVVALLKILTAALRAFRNLPIELQVLLVLGAVLLALHPKTQKGLSAGFSAIADGLRTSAGVFGETFGELALRIAAAQQELKAKEDLVESAVPRRASEPLKTKTLSSVSKRKSVRRRSSAVKPSAKNPKPGFGLRLSDFQ